MVNDTVSGMVNDTVSGMMNDISTWRPNYSYQLW